MKLLSARILCACLGTCLLLTACGGDADEPAQEPGTLVHVKLAQDDPVSREHGTVWRYGYRLPEGTPSRVKATWQVRFIEDGDATKARDIGLAGERSVPPSGTLTFAYSRPVGGGDQFEIHFSEYEGLWFRRDIPTKELTQHLQDGHETWGGGVAMSVAPEHIVLDWDIPLAVKALRATEEGGSGHRRRTLEETLEVHNKVFVLYLRFTAEPAPEED